SALFVTTTKLAGILVTVTVAANAFSFTGYRKTNLKPFRSPIDETSDTLADFFNENLNPTNEFVIFDIVQEENGKESRVFFGLATAPTLVEDKLNDAWLQFAEEQPSDSGETQTPQTADAVLGSAGGDGASQPAPKKSKKKKTLNIAMEAMIRGFQKYTEEEEEDEEPASGDESIHIVAAWHNVPHP
ncbi:hypothetical protein IFM89_015518, partial [Coptis chinensis]